MNQVEVELPHHVDTLPPPHTPPAPPWCVAPVPRCLCSLHSQPSSILIITPVIFLLACRSSAPPTWLSLFVVSPFPTSSCRTWLLLKENIFWALYSVCSLGAKPWPLQHKGNCAIIFPKIVPKKLRIEMNHMEETVQHKTRLCEQLIYSAEKNKPREIKPTCHSWFCVWINRGPAWSEGGADTGHHHLLPTL